MSLVDQMMAGNPIPAVAGVHKIEKKKKKVARVHKMESAQCTKCQCTVHKMEKEETKWPECTKWNQPSQTSWDVGWFHHNSTS